MIISRTYNGDSFVNPNVAPFGDPFGEAFGDPFDKGVTISNPFVQGD